MKLKGFTLIELTIVIIIVAIIAISSVSMLKNTDSIKLGLTAEQVQEDLQYARAYALNYSTCVSINLTSNGYSSSSIVSTRDGVMAITYNPIKFPSSVSTTASLPPDFSISWNGTYGAIQNQFLFCYDAAINLASPQIQLKQCNDGSNYCPNDNTWHYVWGYPHYQPIDAIVLKIKNSSGFRLITITPQTGEVLLK